jgi:hypothetical protein
MHWAGLHTLRDELESLRCLPSTVGGSGARRSLAPVLGDSDGYQGVAGMKLGQPRKETGRKLKERLGLFPGMAGWGAGNWEKPFRDK